jgi:hypothetical protein
VLFEITVSDLVCARVWWYFSAYARAYVCASAHLHSHTARTHATNACTRARALTSIHARAYTHPVVNFLPGQLNLIGAVTQRRPCVALLAATTATARAGRGERDVGGAHTQDTAPVAHEGPVVEAVRVVADTAYEASRRSAQHSPPRRGCSRCRGAGDRTRRPVRLSCEGVAAGRTEAGRARGAQVGGRCAVNKREVWWSSGQVNQSLG